MAFILALAISKMSIWINAPLRKMEHNNLKGVAYKD